MRRDFEKQLKLTLDLLQEYKKLFQDKFREGVVIRSNDYSSKITLPKNWEGKKVMVILL